MATITNLRVAIEGIVFDDYSYAGTDRLLDTLQQGGNPVHR
jgi:hypothetical protein